MNLNEKVVVMWVGFIRFSVRPCGGILRTRYWTVGFHNRLGISFLAEQTFASLKGLCFIKLFIISYYGIVISRTVCPF
jgi:hypothetical protein